ncbi:MurR/RpiR family transcriptional regulator [Bacillus sp. N9]
MYKYLHQSRKKVADYVLANMELTIYMTVTELAERIGVGETTVLRFCRKMGYKGYQSFKMAVTKEVAKLSSEFDETNMEELDEIQNIIQKTMSNNVQVLKETASLIDNNELEKAIHHIITSKRIIFYGAGCQEIQRQMHVINFLELVLLLKCLLTRICKQCQQQH